MASSVTFSFSSLIHSHSQLSSFHPCKNPFQLFPRSPTLSGTPSFALRPHVSSVAKVPATEQLPVKSKTFGTRRKSASGSRSLGPEVDSLDRKNLFSSLVNDKTRNGSVQNGSLRLSGDGNDKSRKSCELECPDVRLRVALDQCSKRADFEGALELYDLARKEGVRLGQYHYNVILYLCSSAAVGFVLPAKSGSGSQRLNSLELSREELSDNESVNSDQVGDVSDGDSSNDGVGDSRGAERVIRLSDDLKEYALKRGFEIYEEMRAENVPMNEASLTSVARMAMSMGDGDMAFDTIKQMISLGINPRLRSYGPALSVFCNSRDVRNAFQVENHMLEHGVYPEEPELEALLRVSVEAGKGDKVYYVLHKLRTSVRKVSPSTAELIEKWFKSSVASKLGKRKWDQKIISEVIQNCGGGWHGQGWLGKGKWNVSRGSVGEDGSCKCCGEKLALIDLDPKETENFAKSVASIATKRERHLSFQKFQKWLDYYGPFEAVIDAANVGLFSQQRFLPSKVNAVVNGLRQKLPSRRWPLIVLHNRRITGPKMNEPVNKALIEKWRNADALNATPTGSNDDWYWLYAAIKFKCLIVTNDEMRDHTFQLLGNDFFPKWKERHQVRFGFSDGGPVFHMPPSYSIVIQESENGHWHIPIAAEHGLEADRTWLCVTRPNSRVVTQLEGKATEIGDRLKLEQAHRANGSDSINPSHGTYDSLRSIFSASVYSSGSTILPELEAAENIGNYTIDFQI